MTEIKSRLTGEWGQVTREVLLLGGGAPLPEYPVLRDPHGPDLPDGLMRVQRVRLNYIRWADEGGWHLVASVGLEGLFVSGDGQEPVPDTYNVRVVEGKLPEGAPWLQQLADQWRPADRVSHLGNIGV